MHAELVGYVDLTKPGRSPELSEEVEPSVRTRLQAR
jgi:hypothetical protein